MADVLKSRDTKVVVSHDGQNENEYSATICEEAQHMVFIHVEGVTNGCKVFFDLEMLRADIPYLVDLLKEFSITGQS